MQSKNDNAKQVVLSYIQALDKNEYKIAEGYLNKSIQIRGPSGEVFSNPADFIGMLQKHRGKYDVKKVFVDGDDVCLFYDFKSGSSVLMCSWYRVSGGKITSIQTIFDPRPFASAASE